MDNNYQDSHRDHSFNPGITRHKIEDSIVARFHSVDFRQSNHAWLDDPVFWDFVFGWHDLARYYEQHPTDTTIGVHLLDLYTACVRLFQQAAQDRSLKERRRDKAADALYQLNFYFNQIMLTLERHVHSGADDDPAGRMSGQPGTQPGLN